MDAKGYTLSNGPVDHVALFAVNNKPEYRRVYHLLDELGFSDHKSVFSENQLRDSNLAYIDSEDELKSLLKEVGLPIGLVFAFVKLWFRCKDKPDSFLVDANALSRQYPNGIVNNVDKQTQTIVNMANVETQTEHLNIYPSPLLHASDPYEMFNPFSSSFQYLSQRMPIPNSINSTYPFAPPWAFNPLMTKSSHYNPSGDVSELSGLVNGFAVSDESIIDPMENFNPHDNEESIPLEKNGSEVVIESSKPVNISSQYSLFPDAEPLCSPKTSHILGDKDDMAFDRSLSQELDHRSYATALKDHMDSQHSLPINLQSEPLLSPGARSRSSSTTSTNNLSRSASSAENHTLNPLRDTSKPPNHRTYAGVDDIDPKSHLIKYNSGLPNLTFSYFYDNLPDSQEYKEAMKEKPVKAGWKPLPGKHEKTGRRYDFKAQYIDKEGRMRHGVRVRGALKSMECWLHTNNKPPFDCLFAHSRIGDTMEFICVRCTFEKGRNYECRDKKGHVSFICNLGPYRDINGEKWRGKLESS